ncbi:choice-of-anchor I family protein [Ulvibacter litoralis]|uniref:Por secretion system C-terminal sorting domain-containing protein n=1 Tax=Ulvibacter litoralis TaxID=227084 RepID=A0A1G7I381_9FLAO|nr:choice-of-anchor I family protein [Ulvibacter litoralis]GHC62629.1 hypothetical protein GCM10008083_29770 [Ulvibacter litoralis]SDF07191.1 Por secretion system C-terminal sorting domain-containing protein [Ulvibacter litoralis]
MRKITFFAALLFSAAAFSQVETVASTSFEEPAPGGQYVDTGDAAIAHDLLNNATESPVDFTSTGGEIGFDASYVPYTTPDVGLTDGDFVGVSDFTGDVTAYSDGLQGYQLSDVDGNMIVEFDVVDFTNYTNTTVSVDYFINTTGYEGDGTVNESNSDRFRIYVRDITNGIEIDILNTEGSDINDLSIEGAWITGNVIVPGGIMAQLVVEARTNSSSETMYLDNILFEGEPAVAGTSDLVITEIFSGQEGADLTADWFEIKNNGTAAWTSGVDADLYYDDDSADPTAADLIQGITQILPGATAIVLVTGNTNDITTFMDVWSPVIDLTGVEVGYSDGAGLGAGGDTVTLWMGDPLTTSPIDSASYPDTAANDGQSYDNDLSAFSVVGNANNAVATVAMGGAGADVPNIASPGNGTPAPLESDLTITEIFSGQEGADLTADWFEIKNNGTVAWVSGVDADLYYDDESADPAAADLILGLTDIQPGATAIVLITGDVADITTFTTVWSPVIDLTGVQIGYTDGAGLGAGGDTVVLWMGDPTTTSPIDSVSYPDTAANDGQSYDNDLVAFSVVGNANGAVATLAMGGAGADVPNIGSPGNGLAIAPSTGLMISEIFSGQAGTDLTVDWFEIKNNGTTAWVSGVDADFYYDDESASGADAVLVQGLTEIQPGATAIVLISGDVADVTTFTDVWNPVIDLTGINIGYADGAGLGAGGDVVTLWLGDPLATSPIDSASYPDTAANDGQSYDVELAAFSVVGNTNGAVETLALGGDASDVPNIASPGNGATVAVPVYVEFESTYVSVSEDGGSLVVTVEVSEAPLVEGTVEVSILSGGTAVEGTHFTLAATETLTFSAGSATSQTINIPIINNTDDESDLFFVLGLGNGTDIEIGGKDMFSVYILDDDTVVPAGDASVLDANYLTSYLVDPSGTAEITAYDSATQRLYVTNATSIEVLDFSDPNNITSLATVDITAYGSGVQSVAVKDGIVAVAVAAPNALDNGFVLFADTDGNNALAVEVGSLPDMLTFTPDGTKVVVANEGQPSNDYTIDPEGTISVIDVSGGLSSISQASVTTLNFNAFDAQQAALVAAGVRVFGPGASVSQDMEPEYVAVSDDSMFAYVSLQENNAYATVDLTSLTITEIKSFGLKDHSLPQNSLDTSDETDFIFNASWPIKGVYMPDAIAHYSVGGVSYLVTANEGDARDYNGYAEERNLGDADYVLDPAVFSEIDILSLGNNLGAINITAASGDADGDGLYEEIHVFGGRSFSIFEAVSGALVYDSGNDFEVITAADAEFGGIFNASNSNNNPKNRSDNKGPEPEGVMVQQIGDQSYAFILLERVGGMMIYNVTDPANPVFLQYVNSRDAIPGGSEGGDLGPEGVAYVSVDESPTGKAMVILSNEVSATLSIYTLDNVLSVDEFSTTSETEFNVYPNPAETTVFFSKPGNYTLFDILGRTIKTETNVASMNLSGLVAGTYIVQNDQGVSQKLIVK